MISPIEQHFNGSALVPVTVVEQVILTARKRATFFHRRQPSRHDLAGYLEAAEDAVLTATRNCRSTDTQGFTRYALTCVKFALLTEHKRQAERYTRECSLSAPLSDDGGTLEDLLRGDAPSGDEVLLTSAATAEEQELFDAVHQALDALPERHKELLLGLFWLELPLPQAAKRIDMPLPVARRVERLSLAHLERVLAGRAELSCAF